MFDWKKGKLRNALIVAYDCNGCMATDHQYRWIGRVEGFEMTRHAGEAARVRIIKRDEAGDFRDHDLGTELVTIDNASLQQMSHGLFFYFR